MILTKDKISVCIIGGGFMNKGAEAMVLTVADAIRKQLSGANIYIKTNKKNLDQIKQNNLLPWEHSKPKGVVSKLRKKIHTAIFFYRCSAFIDVGGYQFGEPWGEESAHAKARRFKHFAQFGNLIFFMPQAWGPFSSPAMCDAIRSIVNNATLCYVRDKTSMTAMEEIIGKNYPGIRLAHDITWNFQGADLSVGRRIIRDAGLPENSKSFVVCVTPNLRVYERCEGTEKNNKYIIFLRAIIEHICSAHNANVILIGHELRPKNSKTKDDRTLCNYLLSSLDKTLPVVHVDQVLSAAEVKSVIGNCDLLLSSRYHALIAALSQEIPVAAIGWSHKYNELLNEVGLDSNTILLSWSVKEACGVIDSIIEHLPESRDIIKSKLPKLQQSGNDAVNEVLSRIKEKT